MNQVIILDLMPGITETEQYKAWKFPGGEIHVHLKEEFQDQLNDSEDDVTILGYTRINNADDLVFLLLVADAIKDTWRNQFHVFIPYMPYQQADRNFADGESFSLRTITRILNSSPIDGFTVIDPHSDVTPALLRNCTVRDNSQFIQNVLEMINLKYYGYAEQFHTNLTLLSPDAGAYKKIFKLAEKIGFKGGIETANKFRDTKTGDLAVRFSCEDFEGKDVLIIDDICVGGRTFTALADQLIDKNAGRLFLAVSHGIFSNGLLDLGRYFSDIFTTNSRRNEYEELIKDVQDHQNPENWANGVAPAEFYYSGRPFQLHVYEAVS